MQHPPGLDLTSFTPWFQDNIAIRGSVLTARLLAGGRPNLTSEVSDGDSCWIVRRPPLGHVLATAHDMQREFQVLTALRSTPVPVPATYAICLDAAVIGTPFYVMERVDGVPYRYASELAALGPARTRVISEVLVDTLVAVHEVDHNDVGLADFGRPENFLIRQVERWRKQMDASASRELPAAADLHAALVAATPRGSAPGIVHGDFRLDNVLINAFDSPAAVIDWEMATIGDPLTDLALMIVYGRLGSTIRDPSVTDAASAPGFLTEDEVVARYAMQSTRDVSQLPFYMALASYKLAAITEGIYARHLKGETVGDGFERIGAATYPLLTTGLTALKEPA